MRAPGAQQPTRSWHSEDERSNLFALRLMAWIALSLGRPVARLVLLPIALYFLLAAAKARRASASYLARVLGRPARWTEQFRHFHAYASTVLDRVYFARGQTQAFDLQARGLEIFHAPEVQGRGELLLGAHLGSFEALHAASQHHPGLRVAMAMYPDNARKIQSVLAAIAPQVQQDVITIGRRDSALVIRDWLNQGSWVGILGDRHLAEAEERSSLVECAFLGSPTLFSEGPLRLAMLLRRRVYFMVALYRGGRRYELRFEPLADFSAPPKAQAERQILVRQALQDYVARLESVCREAPFNWFNFHEFWSTDVDGQAARVS